MDRVSTHIGGTVFTTQAVLPLTSASGSIAFRLDTDLPSVRWKGHHRGQLDGHRGKETRSEEIDEEVEEDEGISWAI